MFESYIYIQFENNYDYGGVHINSGIITRAFVHTLEILESVARSCVLPKAPQERERERGLSQTTPGTLPS